MFIQRNLTDKIVEKLALSDKDSNKIIVLYGPRQAGKTTLISKVLEKVDFKTLSINGDETKYVDVLSSRDFNKMDALVSGYDLLFIDEAQRIPDIGINLKILHDRVPQLRIIATGSASFELANKVKEPLTGRTWTFSLYPVSYSELSRNYNEFECRELLESSLIYGLYPGVFTIKNNQEKVLHLHEICQAYLYKDVFELSGIKFPRKIMDLLSLLAFQIGSVVSISELGGALSISKETVSHYIDLLEKAFVIFRLKGFSKNLRKEITKMDKIYFYDLGIRNTLIDNTKPLSSRNDIGQLWENFIILERKKKLAYDMKMAKQYFWRLYTGAEIDYIEEKEGCLAAYEIKYGKKMVAAPKSWLENYPNSEFSCINKDTFYDFIADK